MGDPHAGVFVDQSRPRGSSPKIVVLFGHTPSQYQGDSNALPELSL